MTVPATPASAERRTFSDSEFRAWLPREGHTMVAISERGDQCYALFLEFNIAGTGRSEEEAMKDAERLFWGYLQYCFLEGRSFAEARKPIPLATQARLRAGGFVSKILHGMKPRFGRIRQLALDAHLGNHHGATV